MQADSLHRLLQRFMDGRTDSADPPGAAWCVGADVVWSRGYSGSSSVEPVREALVPEAMFDLASLTKPLVTALLAAILEQDGVLDLDGPLAEWLPESKGTPYGEASLLDLGAHRAGLPDWEPLYASEKDGARFPDRILALPPAAAPGQTL